MIERKEWQCGVLPSVAGEQICSPPDCVNLLLHTVHLARLSKSTYGFTNTYASVCYIRADLITCGGSAGVTLREEDVFLTERKVNI